MVLELFLPYSLVVVLVVTVAQVRPYPDPGYEDPRDALAFRPLSENSRMPCFQLKKRTEIGSHRNKFPSHIWCKWSKPRNWGKRGEGGSRRGESHPDPLVPFFRGKLCLFYFVQVCTAMRCKLRIFSSILPPTNLYWRKLKCVDVSKSQRYYGVPSYTKQAAKQNASLKED